MPRSVGCGLRSRHRRGSAETQPLDQRSRARLSGAARQGRANASRAAGALDRLDQRSYAAATTGRCGLSTASWPCMPLAGRAAAAGPEGVSP
jgi:hypothetical protein